MRGTTRIFFWIKINCRSHSWEASSRAGNRAKQKDGRRHLIWRCKREAAGDLWICPSTAGSHAFPNKTCNVPFFFPSNTSLLTIGWMFYQSAGLEGTFFVHHTFHQRIFAYGLFCWNMGNETFWIRFTPTINLVDIKWFTAWVFFIQYSYWKEIICLF